MKVAVILLTCGRPDLTERVIKQNFYNSGYDALTILVDNGSTPEDHFTIASSYPFSTIHRLETNKGIAHGINNGISLANYYVCDAIVTLANDILMPDNWLKKMVEYATAIPNTGMAGIHCVEQLPPLVEINGIYVHESHEKTFGNVLITRKAWETIGYFNEDLDPYSNQDADYAYRLMKNGFVNYYLPDLRSEHIGHDVGSGTEYRKMKDKSLDENWKKHHEWLKRYDDTGDYTIFMKEW